jgi:hypothetical protein
MSLSSSVTWFSKLYCVCAAGERDATEADPGAGGTDTEPQEYSQLPTYQPFASKTRCTHAFHIVFLVDIYLGLYRKGFLYFFLVIFLAG